MANGGYGFIGACEVTHNFEYSGIEAYVFRRAASWDYERIVVFGLHFIEGRVEPEIVTTFLAVGLVAFEVMDGGTHGIT